MRRSESAGATARKDVFSKRRGAAQRLPNGNTLVTESHHGRAFELDPNGEIVWEFHAPLVKRPDGRVTRINMFRMYRITEPHTWEEMSSTQLEI